MSKTLDPTKKINDINNIQARENISPIEASESIINTSLSLKTSQKNGKRTPLFSYNMVTNSSNTVTNTSNTVTNTSNTMTNNSNNDSSSSSSTPEPKTTPLKNNMNENNSSNSSNSNSSRNNTAKLKSSDSSSFSNVSILKMYYLKDYQDVPNARSFLFVSLSYLCYSYYVGTYTKISYSVPQLTLFSVLLGTLLFGLYRTLYKINKPSAKKVFFGILSIFSLSVILPIVFLSVSRGFTFPYANKDMLYISSLVGIGVTFLILVGVTTYLYNAKSSWAEHTNTQMKNDAKVYAKFAVFLGINLIVQVCAKFFKNIHPYSPYVPLIIGVMMILDFAFNKEIPEPPPMFRYG